jgi:hypothetical protein
MTTLSSAQAQTDGLIKAMDLNMERLEKKRVEHAEAKVDFERSQELANAIARDRMMTIANSPEVVGSVDPRTGKSNDEWRKWMMESMLERDAEFVKAISEHNEKQARNLHIEADLLSLTEKMGTLRTEAILLSSLLRYEAAASEE